MVLMARRLPTPGISTIEDRARDHIILPPTLIQINSIGGVLTGLGSATDVHPCARPDGLPLSRGRLMWGPGLTAIPLRPLHIRQRWCSALNSAGNLGPTR